MNRRSLIELAQSQWKEDVDLHAAGATCPMPGCGALSISYEASGSLGELRRELTADWEFVCSECGTEFSAPKADLLFQAIPRDWLFSQVCRA